MSSVKTLFVLTAAALLTACSNDNRSNPGLVGTTFEVTIENMSDQSFLPTPLSPGVLLVHDDQLELLTPGVRDSGMGLEALAEDGSPTALVDALRFSAGTFQVTESEAIPPGQSRTFTVVARPENGNLSLATMVVQSNDLFFASNRAGIPLFDSDGDPLPSRDVTSELRLWDAGTETNEIPGGGLNQPFRQSGPNTGAAEGVVHPAEHATRALPGVPNLVSITVTENAGTYTLDFQNVAASRGGFTTPLAPLFWAVHAGGFQLFTEGQPAPANGLEVLAEDGSPAQLLLAAASDSAVRSSGATTGPAVPGDMFSVTVTPTQTHPTLTLACMIVESNDLFLSADVSLLTSAGAPRPVGDIEADLMSRFAVWDAGTELNQALGGGADQPMRQSGPNTGVNDPDSDVRRHADTANDFAQAANLAQVSVTASATPGSFDIVLTNVTSGAFTGVLTPVAFAVHARGTPFFTPGQSASPGLEVLAESGNPMPFVGELGTAPGVTNAGAQPVGVGAAGPGPIGSGGSYAFTITPDRDHPYLSLVSMVVPSNDTFLALGPDGVLLMNTGTNTLRSASDVEADIAAALSTWDAGTEFNQVGAAGSDQAPRQSGPDVGDDEGDGTVRIFTAPGMYPAREQLIRVTVRPR